MKRRNFLLAGVGAGGALFLGWSLLPLRQRLRGSSPLNPPSGGHALNGWVIVGTDDSVTIVMAKAEMGQGIHTAAAMMLADEMDADWAKVRVVPASIDAIYNNISAITEGLPFPPESNGAVVRGVKWMTAKTMREFGVMMTGGSSSIRDLWEPMRDAGAAAREALRAAAASQWNVPADQCTVAKGVVSHAGQSLTFGALAALAPSHLPTNFTRKTPAQFTLMGNAMPRIDADAKSTGRATFGIDVRVPDLLHAAVTMSPTYGGTPKAFDAAAAKKMPGVVAVVALPGSRYGDQAGVAIVANSWWQAKQALGALNVTWEPGPNATLSSVQIQEQLRNAAMTDGGFAFRSEGNAVAALAGSARVVEALYEAPYLAHATMEPMNCTVQVQQSGVSVWAGTQVPNFAREAAALGTNRSVRDVTVHPMLIGGGFGRRLDVDFIAQAAVIAAAVPGKAVQTLWSREDDMLHGFPRPAAASRLRAGLDTNGNITSFVTHSASQAPFQMYSRRVGFIATEYGPDRTVAEGTWDQPYEFPAQHAAQTAVELAVPVASWRAVGHSHQGFFVEGFLDEVAAATKTDPYQFRLRLLRNHPRAASVLTTAAKMAQWQTAPAPTKDGRPVARGIALHASFGTIAAHVAEVSIGNDGKIQVHRIVVVADCGFVVNPDGARQQLESATLYGLTAALYGEITIVNGAVQQRNFDTYKPLRMDESPVLDVHLMQSAEPPSGLGEPGLPSVAPAVANAIFALTGTRLRSLPLRLPTVAAT